jgi:hypothetical protein
MWQKTNVAELKSAPASIFFFVSPASGVPPFSGILPVFSDAPSATILCRGRCGSWGNPRDNRPHLEHVVFCKVERYVLD